MSKEKRKNSPENVPVKPSTPADIALATTIFSGAFTLFALGSIFLVPYFASYMDFVIVGIIASIGAFIALGSGVVYIVLSQQEREKVKHEALKMKNENDID